MYSPWVFVFVLSTLEVPHHTGYISPFVRIFYFGHRFLWRLDAVVLWDLNPQVLHFVGFLPYHNHIYSYFDFFNDGLLHSGVREVALLPGDMGDNSGRRYLIWLLLWMEVMLLLPRLRPHRPWNLFLSGIFLILICIYFVYIYIYWL